MWWSTFKHSNSRLTITETQIEYFSFVLFSIQMKRCYFVTVNKINKSPVSINSYSDGMNRISPNEWNIFLHLSEQRTNEWVNRVEPYPPFIRKHFSCFECNAILTSLSTVCLWWRKNLHHFPLTVPVAIVNDYSR